MTELAYPSGLPSGQGFVRLRELRDCLQPREVLRWRDLAVDADHRGAAVEADLVAVAAQREQRHQLPALADAITTVAEGWETLTFDFASPAPGTAAFWASTARCGRSKRAPASWWMR